MDDQVLEDRLVKLQKSVDELTAKVDTIVAVFEQFSGMFGGGDGGVVDASVKLLG